MRKPAGAVVLAVLRVVLSSCSGGATHHTTSVGAKSSPKPVSRASLAAAAIQITPAGGSQSADPSAGVAVTAAKGTLKNVVVTTGSGTASAAASPSASASGSASSPGPGPVPGSLRQRNTQW